MPFALEHHLARLRLESAVGTELVQVDLTNGATSIGKRLRDIKLPNDCVIISIQRGGRVIIPRGNTQLLKGDRVVAHAVTRVKADLERILCESDDDLNTPVQT